jgi:4-oxalomesaconate tautomerase
MQTGIRCMLMRGGTSKGAYFLASDLPANVKDRDDLLLRVMGSPDPRQIDGIGGAHPLTSKVAIVSCASTSDADIDFLFAQVKVDEALVDTTPNCGNILAGVGPFAIERGLIRVKERETRVRIRTLNTQTLAELVVSTPSGSVCYNGEDSIDGVPGTGAAIPTYYLNTEGSVCGSLFPTGASTDRIQGIEVTCIDNGMPVVLMRAADLGLSGKESCSEIEAASEALARVESIRLDAGLRMGLGDVKDAVVPKMGLLSPSGAGNCINTRMLIPTKCHDSIGVFAAVTVATACVLPCTIAQSIASVPAGRTKLLEIEHPTGKFQVTLQVGGTEASPKVERAGVIRTARALFDGVVFPRPARIDCKSFRT